MISHQGPQVMVRQLTNDDMPSSVCFIWHCFIHLVQKSSQHFTKTVETRIYSYGEVISVWLLKSQEPSLELRVQIFFDAITLSSGKDHDRRLRRLRRHCQHWRKNYHQSPLCWWHWWLSRRERRTGKISWASLQSLHSLRHGDQCREDQADDKQH